MAGHRLIDEYLDELRRNVAGWHSRPDDLVAEAADHLEERVAALVAAGESEEHAAGRSVTEYGDVRQVADAHLRAAKRPAIPTDFTRSGGQLAMAGGGLWILLLAMTVALANVENTFGWAAMATVMHVAVVLSLMATIALWQRHGGFGFLSVLAAVPAALSVPFVLFAWPVLAWLVLLGLSTLFIGIAMFVGGLLPRIWVAAFTFGLSGAGAVGLSAEMMLERGGEDWAFLASTSTTVAVMVGIAVFGVGLIGIGRWLHAETAVVIPVQLPAPLNR